MNGPECDRCKQLNADVQKEYSGTHRQKLETITTRTLAHICHEVDRRFAVWKKKTGISYEFVNFRNL